MSTHYKELTNVYEDIKAHYDDEDLYIELIDGDFNDQLVEIVQDAFVGETTTHLTVRFTDKFGNDIMYIISMSTDSFKRDWAEKVWTKFRADMNDTICPHCGEKMAHSVAGRTLSDIGRIDQFFCEGCGYVWVGYPSGKFIREGVLSPSQWEIR